jgi:hypothetical protein
MIGGDHPILHARSTSLLWLIVGEEFRLLRGDALAVEFGEPDLPFLDQFLCLAASPLGAGEHTFDRGSLSIEDHLLHGLPNTEAVVLGRRSGLVHTS